MGRPEQLTGSRLRKEYNKAVCYHPVYLYAEHIMRNARLDELQFGIKIARRNINTSDMWMTSPLWQKVKKN